MAIKRLMTDKELAEYTGFSVWAINEARRKGTMPGVVSIPGIRKFYYNADAIDIWLNGQQEQPQELRLVKAR